MPPDGTPAVIPQRYEEAVELSRLTPHPANPNMADVGLICQLLDSNGFVGAVLAQESTGILIDGEHRLKAANLSGMTTIPVVWLDVDDDQRDRLLASINESTRRGYNDEVKMVALLKGLAVTPEGLAGTAHDGDDLDAMIRRLEAGGKFDVSGEWQGMPDFQNPGRASAYSTVVHFPSHDAAAEFFRLIERPLTRSLWWPHGDNFQGDLSGDTEEVSG